MSVTRSVMPELSWFQSDDSMLSRRFGTEVVNYYAGGNLNRYSFLRSDAGFLKRAAISPFTRYIALNTLSPLVTNNDSQLAYLMLDDVQSIIGTDPFAITEDEDIRQYDSTRSHPLIVFLGLLEGSKADSFATAKHGTVEGAALFALDVTPKGAIAAAANAFRKAQEDKGLSFQKNPRSMTLQAEDAAIYAQARSIIDWNGRHPFCAGCGNPMLSIHAGFKRTCPPTDLQGGTDPQRRTECATRHGVSNICFPRTDPVMIAAVASADGQRVLLGRQGRFPPHWYSALAGFVEPGESIEEAVRREVWEEAGIKVGRVVIHSSQPWPYPSSLMIGAIAQALPGEETINLNDKELDDAKWFTIAEVQEALKFSVGELGAPAPEGYVEGRLRLPPPQAIANRLVASIAEGYLSPSGPKI